MTGDQLRELREHMKMTQTQLGTAIGMSRETIGKMERGEAPIEKRTGLAVRYVRELRCGQ